jgi:hypothetical protein
MGASASVPAVTESVSIAGAGREIPAGDPKRSEVAVPPRNEGGRECSGRVLLLDGSPLSDCRIVAVDSAMSSSLSSVDGAKQPGQLASTVTGLDGSFVLRFELDTALNVDLAFRILHFASGGIPQLDTVYRLSNSRDIVHRLPVGRLVVKTISSDGAPIANALVWLQPLPGEGRLGTSSKEGECSFILTSSTLYDIRAYQGALRVGASACNRSFDPEQRRDVRLELLPMDRGQLRVRIVDQNDQPVPRFALRIRWHGELVRHVTDADLGGSSVVTGLPETEVSIDLDRCYSNVPSMYFLPKQANRRWATPNPSPTEELLFRVTVFARLRFDVKREDGSSKEELAVFVRGEKEGPQGKWRRVGVEQYHTEGSTASTAIQGDGLWFSEPLEPGMIEVEIRKEGPGSPVFAGWVQLIAGTATERVLRLR